jgi:hypothetical protein
VSAKKKDHDKYMGRYMVLWLTLFVASVAVIHFFISAIYAQISVYRGIPYTKREINDVSVMFSLIMGLMLSSYGMIKFFKRGRVRKNKVLGQRQESAECEHCGANNTYALPAAPRGYDWGGKTILFIPFLTFLPAIVGSEFIVAKFSLMAEARPLVAFFSWTALVMAAFGIVRVCKIAPVDGRALQSHGPWVEYEKKVTEIENQLVCTSCGKNLWLP